MKYFAIVHTNTFYFKHTVHTTTLEESGRQRRTRGIAINGLLARIHSMGNHRVRVIKPAPQGLCYGYAINLHSGEQTAIYGFVFEAIGKKDKGLFFCVC